MDKVLGWKGSIWATKGLVNITYYTGALVKLISIHLMISSINIYFCVLPLILATKQTFFNFIAQAMSSMNSLLHLRERKKDLLGSLGFCLLILFFLHQVGNTHIMANATSLDYYLRYSSAIHFLTGTCQRHTAFNTHSYPQNFLLFSRGYLSILSNDSYEYNVLSHIYFSGIVIYFNINTEFSALHSVVLVFLLFINTRKLLDQDQDPYLWN